MKEFNYKKCIKEIKEIGNWHLGDKKYGKLKKLWIENIITIINNNIKQSELLTYNEMLKKYFPEEYEKTEKTEKSLESIRKFYKEIKIK